jgi:hypothetical protein
MTFGGYTVAPDPDWPKLYRVRHPDGSLSDMVNLSRAREAPRAMLYLIEQTSLNKLHKTRMTSKVVGSLSSKKGGVSVPMVRHRSVA